jgi:adenine-specific DNA-methyltransferase
MPKGAGRPPRANSKRKIEHYTHVGKDRANNPPVGLVTPETDRDAGNKSYAYDPHNDPALQWAGKAERTSFEIPTVSLHVHERIDPRSIIEAVRKKNGEDFVQGSLFSRREENPPIREAIEFYKHKHNWSNRLIAGDSLLVMNSLLEKEGMAGKVQMVYIDPPYGIEYKSNFQPFLTSRDVKDKDEDLTQEPETIRAFRDTWQLQIHSYLAYLRDRLLLCRDLLSETGSIFVQINDENLSLVDIVMSEVFDADNFIVHIPFKKKGGQKGGLLDPVNDYLVWFAKDKKRLPEAYNQLYEPAPLDSELVETFRYVEMPDGTELTITELEKREQRPKRYYRDDPERILKDFPRARIFKSENVTSGGFRKNQSLKFEYKGKSWDPGIAKGNCWKHTVVTDDGSVPGMERLAAANRLFAGEGQLRFRGYADDFGYKALSNWWDGLGGAADPIYVVQTNTEIVKRCILMTTQPGDLVFDPTCGSGTTAFVAEQWGRRWITCDSSRVSLALARQRLMNSVFDYYQLVRPDEGVDSGFVYTTAPHITSTTIANAEPPKVETLYDRPISQSGRTRVSGPFTVEAVPAPVVRSLDDIQDTTQPADDSIARSGETQRQGDWRDELLKTGIRGKGKQRIDFSRVEPLAGTRWLHADAETKESTPQRVVVSFGPDHAPLEQRQVELALNEAETLRPKPRIVVFAAFQFDPEAAKDIDETNWPGVTLLKAQMNADLLTDDLKKKRASNDSFWLIGQPDVELVRLSKGEDKGKCRVSVNGFDYYNTKTGDIESGGTDKIAMWMLDPDYDGRSLFPRQVFFIADVMKEGLKTLAENLKAEIDETLIQAYLGTTSLPFTPGKHNRAAVKIIDDRGIETFKVIALG